MSKPKPTTDLSKPNQLVAACVFVETWVMPDEHFRLVESSMPILEGKFTLDLTRPENQGWQPRDRALAQTMEGIASLNGVRKFNALTLEIPQRHLFDRELDVQYGTYVWLRWNTSDAAGVKRAKNAKRRAKK